jgi:hypothetical protein
VGAQRATERHDVLPGTALRVDLGRAVLEGVVRVLERQQPAIPAAATQGRGEEALLDAYVGGVSLS